MPISSAFIWMVARPAISDADEAVVADQFGVGVLVRVLRPHDRRHVEAGPVGERRRPDIGSLRVDGPVERLRDVMAHRGRPPVDVDLQAARLDTELELQVRDDRREIGVAGALAKAVERPLHVAGAGLDGRHEAGRGQPVSSWQWMPMMASAPTCALTSATIRTDLARQGAAVGVAQHEM